MARGRGRWAVAAAWRRAPEASQREPRAPDQRDRICGKIYSLYLLAYLVCTCLLASCAILNRSRLDHRIRSPSAIGHRPSPSASMHQPSPHHALAKRHRLRTAHTSDTSVSHWPHSRTGTSLSSSSTHTHTYPRTRYPSGPLAPPAPPRAASSSTLCGRPTLLSPATASCRGM